MTGVEVECKPGYEIKKNITTTEIHCKFDATWSFTDESSLCKRKYYMHNTHIHTHIHTHAHTLKWKELKLHADKTGHALRKTWIFSLFACQFVSKYERQEDELPFVTIMRIGLQSIYLSTPTQVFRSFV